MTISTLPARPSLDSLRKQAKKLARDTKAADPHLLARVQAHLPGAGLPISLRDAQLVLAREYGFSGWRDLLREVHVRLGRGLEWAVAEARRVIHDDDGAALRTLLSDYPALLSWKANESDGGLLGMATGSYGDSFDPVSEEHFTRPAQALILLDAGAFVSPRICDGLIAARARKLIEIFYRRGLLPQTLVFLAARGQTESIRERLETGVDNVSAVNQALMYACHLGHAGSAGLLLDRSIALDPELGTKVDASPGRAAFVGYFIENKPDVYRTATFSPWQEYVKQQVSRALHDGDLEAFAGGLRRDAWLLSGEHVDFQVRLTETAVLGGREDFLATLLDLDPALLRRRDPPPSQAIEFAFSYVKTHMLPLLSRIWPMPVDLPHAAGNGDLDGVKRWFDREGKAVLGLLNQHFPVNNAHYCVDYFQWFGERPGAQRILDTALAWAVLNSHFEIADFLLAHGADINTNWSSHEPASILHELVWHKNYEAMQFLIDRGIDMTIQDYRWGATAEGWARVASNDAALADFLREARQRREQASGQNGPP